MQTLSENPLCNPACRVCHYKTLDYSDQVRRKQEWAMKQLGSWKGVLEKIRPAPEGERLAYRSKSWMKSDFQDDSVSFGMFRSIQVDGEWEKEFISWDSCPLHVQPIQEMIQNLRRHLVAEASEFVQNSLVGVWMGSPHLVIVSRDQNSEPMKQLKWDQILVPPFDRVWFHCNPQVGRKIFGHHPIESLFSIEPTQGPTAIETVHPIRAFRQVAQTLLVEARKMAVENLLRDDPALIVDLYCGTGDLSLLLPPKTGWLGIELSQEAVIYANSLSRPTSHKKIHSAYVGGVEHRLQDPRVLSQIQAPYSLFLNPPRSGLSEQALEKVIALICAKIPKSIVYLSCSASSLARDLREMENVGFYVERLQPYDFFPQTEHFETLAVLRPQNDSVIS